MSTANSSRLALAAALVHVVFATLWIVAPDRLLDLLPGTGAGAGWQTAKGLLLVAFAGTALDLLLRSALARAAAEPAVRLERPPDAPSRWPAVAAGLYLVVLVAGAIVAWRGLTAATHEAHAQQVGAAAAVLFDRVRDWTVARLAVARALAADPTMDAGRFAAWVATPDAAAAGVTGAWLLAGDAPRTANVPAPVRAVAALAGARAAPIWGGGRLDGTRLLLALPRAPAGGVLVVAHDPAVALDRPLRSLGLAESSATGLPAWSEGDRLEGLAPDGAMDAGRRRYSVPRTGPDAVHGLTRAAPGRAQRRIDHLGREALVAMHAVAGTPFHAVVSVAVAGIAAAGDPLVPWFAATLAVLVAATGAFARGWWRVQFAERRAVQARLDHLARYARDGVVLADAAQRIVDVNDSVVGLLGLPRERIVGHTLAEFCAPDSRIDLHRLWALASLPQGSLTEAQIVRADGTVAPVEVSTGPVDLAWPPLPAAARARCIRAPSRAGRPRRERGAPAPRAAGDPAGTLRSRSAHRRMCRQSRLRAHARRGSGHVPCGSGGLAGPAAPGGSRAGPRRVRRLSRRPPAGVPGRVPPAHRDRRLAVDALGGRRGRPRRGRPAAATARHPCRHQRSQAGRGGAASRAAATAAHDEGTRAGTWEWNVQTGELVVNER